MRQVWLVFGFLPIIWSVCVGGGPAWNKHHTNDEVKAILDDVHSRCPDRTRVYSLPDSDQIPQGVTVPDETVNGTKIWAIQFTRSLQGPKHLTGVPDFKYIGNMHGNEVIGKEILLRLIVLMCDVLNNDYTNIDSEHWDGDDLRWLLDNTNIHILPSLNPDGWALANAVEDKNSREAWLTGRSNGNDVDLNRNFPDLDMKYYLSAGHPGDHNNHIKRLEKMLLENNGANGKLEAETRMVMTWIMDSDTPWVLSTNMHGGDLVANYPFDEAMPGKKGKSALTPDDALFKNLALSYSLYHKVMSKPHKPCDMTNDDFSKAKGTTNGAKWYSVAGGMQDFNYLASNSYEITLELGCEKFPPAQDLEKYWNDNFDAMINFMFQTHLGIKGLINVPAKYKDVPVAIKVYENGNYIDHDILSTKFGDYFRLLNPGTYRVEAVLPLQEGEQCVQSKDVTIDHDPADRKTAKIVNFDFVERSDDKQPTLSCQQEAAESMGDSVEARLQEEYYMDYLYNLLRRQKAYNRNRYMY